MHVENFKAAHLEHLQKTGITDKKLQPTFNQWSGASLEASGEAFTLLNEKGEALMIAGVRLIWFNRAVAWAVFGQTVKADFVKIHNLVRKFLDASPIKRIEAVVEYDFFEGHRWVRTLGFKKEADYMENYHADGRHASLYARIKE